MSLDSSSAQSSHNSLFKASTNSECERKHQPPLDAKLENRLTKRDLERLHRSFLIEVDGCHSKLSLTKDQFCEALSLLLKKGTAEEYAELFDKIDVMKEGSVNWDSLASHLLLEYYEKDDRVKSTQVPQWKDIRILQSPHKETVQRVSFLKTMNRYIAISKEGCVSWWSTDLKLQWSLKTWTDTCKMQDLWVTHFVPLQNVNKIAVAFTSKEIAIYDLSSKLELNCQYKIHGLCFTPLCLDYWYNPINADEAILVWGDVGGFINIIFFNTANIALFERPPAPAGEKQEPCLNVQLKDIVSGMYKNTAYVKYEAHNVKCKGEWVRKVQYSLFLECFISCATTDANSLVIGWMEKHTNATERGVQPINKEIHQKFAFSVSQGVNDFDYNENLNLLATAGINNHVCLWNPYVVSKPNGILRGHMAGVVKVQFITSRSQLISISKDKVLRIWDVQLQVCIQRLAGMFLKGPEAVSSLLFDDGKDRDGHERNKLFITFSHQITAMEMKSEVKDRTVSHERPVVAALYNSVYNQVYFSSLGSEHQIFWYKGTPTAAHNYKKYNSIVSACQAGTIIMWLIDTGQKVKQFNKAHGNSEVTCLTQDQSETRLFTGSTDGTVKVWDFNGHCFHSLECSGGQPADVGQVLVLKRAVISIGWAKSIAVFRNNAFKEFLVKPSEWKGGKEHAEDILSCAFMGPNTLATGSYDGEVIIWNTNSEHASRHCVQRSRRSLISTDKTVVASQVTENDFGWSVVRLIFLENRRNSGTNGGANLVSCGGNGWVRFWNATQSTLVAEFVAHENVGSIIMAADRNYNFIVTADAEGFIKVWEIQEYATSFIDPLITNPPSMKSLFQPHQDQINSLEICERNEQLLIISASSDCSVAIWDINGHKIGIFGQEEHWKIDLHLPSLETKTEEKQQKMERDVNTTSVMEMDEDPHWEPDEAALIDPKKYRINTWNKTELGKDYQKLRVQKRERKQPSTIPDLPYLHWEKTGAPLSGPYSALETQELTPLQNLVKPDTEKYFIQKPESGKLILTKLPVLAETLTTAFDEKSMFPNYILEFEKRMKNYHTGLLNQSQSKDKHELPGLLNSGARMSQVGFSKSLFLHKSISSRGTLGLQIDPMTEIRTNSTSSATTFNAD